LQIFATPDSPADSNEFVTRANNAISVHPASLAAEILRRSRGDWPLHQPGAGQASKSKWWTS